MSRLKVFSPLKLALILAALFVVWLAIGDKKQAQESAPAPQAHNELTLPRVEVRVSRATLEANDIVLQGQVEPWARVAVKAQVSGQVSQLKKRQGDVVKTGDVLLVLTDEGRPERLAEAQSTLALREKELESAVSLQSSRLVAETEITRLQSALAQARADLEASRLAVKYSQPASPFDGMVNRRYVDQGEFVSVGESLMDVVDISKLKVTAYVPQQKIGNVQVGQSVEVVLLGGEKLSGTVSFVSFSADEQTRAFYIEVTVPNPSLARVSGGSATLHIKSPKALAHTLSPALFSLNVDGQLGVYTVDDDDTVQFQTIDILNVENLSASVLGLPEEVRLITLGAGFVSPGQKVEVVEATP